jgi:hypothetical protein
MGRTSQLEEIINLLMDPNPLTRPSIEEVLLHPRMQVLANSNNLKKTLNFESVGRR